MYNSIRSTVLAIGVLLGTSLLPLSTAAPAVGGDGDGLGYSNATATDHHVQAAAATADLPCVVTSIPGSASCVPHDCPASTQCAVSGAGNCVWAIKDNKKRPFACVQCKCVKG